MTPAPKPVPRPPKVKKPPKRRNVKRHTREWLRAYGSEERQKWVESQPCVVCGRTPSDNHHIETGGSRRKADADKIVPLCATSHRVLHQVGQQTYQEFYEINLAALAAKTEADWQSHLESQRAPKRGRMKAV